MQSIVYLWRLARALPVLARWQLVPPPEHKERFPIWLRLVGWLASPFRKSYGAEERPGVRLARALESLGPTYVKLGQLLATRPDIIGAEEAQDLSSLQDRMAAVPTAEARKAVEEGLGHPVEMLFQDFSDAVGAASIAQVHRAIFVGRRGERRDVAVKVLRPGIERRCARDIAAMRWAARQLERLIPPLRRLEPVAVVDTLDRSLDKELDLRMEAAAAGELAERSAKDTLIVIPDVIWERTSRRVLTLNWLEGVKLTNPQALKQAGTDHARLAQTVLDIFLTHAMREGVFHADMHPGNLFRLPGDRLGLVDFGILGRLDEAGQRYLAEILWAFLRRDYQAAARAHFDAGYVPADFDVGDFAQALRAIGEPVFGKRARDVSMAQLLLQLFEVTAMFNMRLRPELVLLQKTMVTVEGVARTIYPDIDMWEAARPAVERYIRSGQGPRAALRSVYRDGKAAAALPARIPRLAEKGEDALTKLERGELSLSEDTLNALAGALSGRGRWARRLFWVAVGAGLVLVFGG